MTEYIDKEVLLRDLERKIKADNERRMAVVDRDFIDLVNDATVVEDVVEVVRCKDCKHYGTSGCAMDTYTFDVVEEGFCSYGERKHHDR